jgi:Chaperone of endosialidase
MLDNAASFLQCSADMKTEILQLKHLMNCAFCPRALLLIPLALVCFALSPQARAVTPAPDGGYPNQNTAEGDNALLNLDTLQGGSNTAIGYNALVSTIAGFSNTAIGSGALEDDMGTFFQGSFNTAIGAGALTSNTTGNGNTATGDKALEFNTTGSGNTAVGETALNSNTTGNGNTANGSDALFNNTTGSNNIALGSSAGVNLSTGSNNIDIGNAGVTGESSKIRIGTRPAQKATFIAGISGVTVANGVGVIINTQGQLGTVVSSERFKADIKPMDKASEALLALKPVTFRYKHELDPVGIPQFGLVAEDVEKVNPDLVARDEQGKPYTVRYEAVNAMLLNEFLKEHREVQELKKQVATLIAGLQKVSAELELTKSAPRTVRND